MCCNAQSVCCHGHSLRDRDHQDLAPTMNAVTLHSKLVDSFDELMVEQCDMSFLGYVTHMYMYM